MQFFTTNRQHITWLMYVAYIVAVVDINLHTRPMQILEYIWSKYQ